MFKILKNTFLVVILGIFISARSTTAKKVKVQVQEMSTPELIQLSI